jgi:hypothetical protein
MRVPTAIGSPLSQANIWSRPPQRHSLWRPIARRTSLVQRSVLAVEGSLGADRLRLEPVTPHMWIVS